MLSGAESCFMSLAESVSLSAAACLGEYWRVQAALPYLSQAFCVGAIGGFCNPAHFSLQMGQHPNSMGGGGLEWEDDRGNE